MECCRACATFRWGVINTEAYHFGWYKPSSLSPNELHGPRVPLVCPDLAIFCTLGNFFAQIAHILGNFCIGAKIFHLSSGIIFGQLLKTFGDFLLVTLGTIKNYQCPITLPCLYVSRLSVRRLFLLSFILFCCQPRWSVHRVWMVVAGSNFHVFQRWKK